jgi:hypothetical protein
MKRSRWFALLAGLSLSLSNAASGAGLSDSEPGAPGPDDVGFVEGEVVLETGKGFEGALLRLTPRIGPEGLLPRLIPQGPPPSPVRSGPDGRFRIESRPGRYWLTAWFGTESPPEWVAERADLSIEPGQTTRGIRIEGVRGALIEVVVLDAERRPARGARVRSGQSAGLWASQWPDGPVVLRVLPGPCALWAHKEGFMEKPFSIIAEPGATHRVEIQLEPLPGMTVTVRCPEGKPAAGIRVRIMGAPMGLHSFAATPPQTDDQGEVPINWALDSAMAGLQQRIPPQFARERNQILAYDVEQNLVALAPIELIDGGTVEITLCAGISVVGSVRDSEDRPVANARISAVLRSEHIQFSHVANAQSDEQGRFKMTALLPDLECDVSASADGFGSDSRQVLNPDGKPEVELEPFVLRRADRDLAGRVLDENGKPIQGALVIIRGAGQPNAHTTTDQAGKFAFKVCEGNVEVSARALDRRLQLSPIRSIVNAGDTNVLLQAQPRGDGRNWMGPQPFPPRPPPPPQLPPFQLL